MQKFLAIPPFFAVAFLCSQVAIAADKVDDWMYPGLQKVGGAGQFQTGDVAHLRHFHYFTNDAFSDVITWYARKHGVKEEHDLFKKLKGQSVGEIEPFIGTIKDVSSGSKETVVSLVIYEIVPHRAHVTFVKPAPEDGQTIVVSIAGDASKTTVHFVQRLTNRCT